MTKMASIKGAIARERAQREAFSENDLVSLVRTGAEREALDNLVFFASPKRFVPCVQAVQRELEVEFSRSAEQIQERYLRFLTNLVLSLRSCLPLWNLQNIARRGGAALDDVALRTLADGTRALAIKLADQAPNVAERLLADWRAETTTRLQAEHVQDPQSEADALVGNSIAEYLTNLTAEIARSNLRHIAEMQLAGQTLTEISNDYAAFLQYAMYLGASFATTNPPLVDYAWLAHPEHWNPIVDSIITDNPEARADELARLVTLEVVLANMRLLRPIFLLTDGGMGCVCLQVNPHNHGDAGAMISEALFLYDELRTKLDGGVPNVVFKLPGTKAGLEACRALTGQGIGVTITVNFGMFQHIPFVEAMSEGQAIYSNLVEMNGRLAYPVRDELLGKLDELSTYGIDEDKAREAAAWAGVAVIKRVYALLTEKGYDLRRFKPLVASLRIYRGDGYGGLPSAFPDVTETLGASIISVFPNVRRPFDQQSETRLEPMRIEVPVSDDVLAVLAHSEIFKQAYYVADRDWVAAEDGRFRPDYELTLDDEDAVVAWAPVHNTLTGFQDSYDTFVQRILGRKRSSS
ncbi:MAG: hypothetical protein GTN93_19920 [Anaerolineae bacterium]|nr:hypothetical protein [Anaerolineae bacterium]NIQ80311.1 hypothetical protein [Anaerolineae bacterium]